MTDLQSPMQPNQSKSKSNLRLVSIFVIGVTLILSIMIYRSGFLEQSWGLQEVFQNQDNWFNQHITHYRMSVDLPDDTTYFGQLPMPLTIEVKDGSIVSMVDAQGKMVSFGAESDPEHYYQEFFTIQGLFSYVRQYYLKKPPAIEISYDPVYGFPSSIYIDPYTEPCCQDFKIDIRDFQVLP